MDIFVLKALVDALQQQLPGAMLTKAFQVNSDDLVLRLWQGRDLRLCLSTHATLQRLCLTTQRFENPRHPPRFAAFLRAHLKHTRLRHISVQPYDRVVCLTWAHPDSTAAPLRLMHELTGRQANVILIDHAGTILEALKRVHPRSAHHRSILPGDLYRPLPPPPQRLLLPALTLGHLLALHQQDRFDALHLRHLLIGVSPVLIAELLHRSQGDPQRCWDLLHQLRQQYEDCTLRLSICTMPEGTSYLSVLPLTHGAASVDCFDSAQEAVTRFYDPVVSASYTEDVRRKVRKRVRQRLQKLRRKIANVQRDYRALQSYLPYQQYGTLLVAQHLPRGADSATVIDYYHPDQPTITIPLDPRLSIRDNAQVYFKKYRKAKSGLVKVRAVLDECAAQERHLVALAQQTEQAEDSDTLDAVAEQLSTRRSSAEGQRRAASRRRPKPAPPYRTFVSRDGYTLHCGKSHHGNEMLLRRVAAPDDIWLHAHQQAGAHVIIKVGSRQEVPRQTLLEAAALAAFYSRGKRAASVEVIYARVQQLRKFRGAQPGQVQVTQYRTLEVAPRRPNP